MIFISGGLEEGNLIGNFWINLKKKKLVQNVWSAPSPLDAQNGAIDEWRDILLGKKKFGPWTYRDEREEYGRDERKSAAADGPMITRRGGGKGRWQMIRP